MEGSLCVLCAIWKADLYHVGLFVCKPSDRHLPHLGGKILDLKRPYIDAIQVCVCVCVSACKDLHPGTILCF